MQNHEGPAAGLDPERLHGTARRWNLELRYSPQTGSTNADAVAWARDLPPGGGLVVTDHQTGGRGRMGRSWFDTPGACLLFSLVLARPFEPALLGLVPLAAGVALCSAVRAEAGAAGAGAADTRLKWPNDLLVGGLKAGGILCESAAGPGPGRWTIVGVGVNVNVPAAEFPADLEGSATSLSAHLEGPIDRCNLLEAFLEAFIPLCEQLERGERAALLEEYRSLCETIGRPIRATTASGDVEGTAVAVDASGALVLDSGDLLWSADVVHLLAT